MFICDTQHHATCTENDLAILTTRIQPLRLANHMREKVNAKTFDTCTTNDSTRVQSNLVIMSLD